MRNMLQDSKIAAQVQPLSEACRSTNCNCTSTILSAGMQNVRPHISRKESGCSNLAVIRLEHVPSYQFDVWTGGLDTPSLKTLSCTMYGSATSRLQLCIGMEREQAAILKTGWRPWRLLSSSSNATLCEEPSSNLLKSSAPVWTAISIAAWNRTATHVLSMLDGSIKYVEELGPPRPLPLDSAGLFTALDELFLPLRTNTTIDAQVSDLRSTITTLLASMLGLPDFGISQPWMGSEAKERYLANTVLMPLFLYHDLFLGIDLMTKSEHLDLQIGEAFQVPVSFAEHEVATPATWSIIAYAALGGVILFAIAIGQILIVRRFDVAKSNFPLVDIALQYKFVEDSGKVLGAYEDDPNSSSPARTRLRSGGGETSRDVLRRAARLQMFREVA